MYSLNWPYVYGIPNSTANIKLLPEDFQVNELLNEPFTGTGEHIVLKIEKKGVTTEDVVKSLARLINKPAKFISYAGLKDKQALTTQWFSIHAPGEVIDGVDALAAPGWRVLEWTRNHKKLKPGFLSGNQFLITIKNVSQIDDLIQRIEQIKMHGVPNYFGEQRFGRECANLTKAEEMLVQGRKVKDRFLKGIYCSAARSWLYNLILSERVKDSSWNKPLAGDMMQLGGSNSIFVNANDMDDQLLKRIREKDISPASPLPGQGGRLINGGRALEIVNKIYVEWAPWLEGLKKMGVEESWRANILHVEQLQYEIKNNSVELSFILPPGSYATVVLRELVLKHQQILNF